MAADRRLFRELQLRCGLSVPGLARSTTDRTAEPGACDVALVFHSDRGSYGDVALDRLNVVLAAHAPGLMADGNWAVAAYIDERADDRQTAALGAIFTGAAGGPMAAFAALVGTQLGVIRMPISYTLQRNRRSVDDDVSDGGADDPDLSPDRIGQARAARPLSRLGCLSRAIR